MRRLAFLSVFLVLAGAASADDLDSAVLRGSSGFEVPARGAPIYAADAPYYPLESDVPAYAPAAPPVVTIAHELSIEVGGRFWYSTGRFQKDLFNDPRFGNNMVSRLTYDGLSGRSYELFARVDHASGFFLKGYAGLGSIFTGTLTDEDFPPAVVPYSNTLSDQRGGTLGYVTADFGYDVFRAPWYRVGLFAGYNYMAEIVNAYGCTQTSANQEICVPTIPPQVLAITEDSGMHSIRLGIAADVLLFDCLKLGGEAAWVPYAKLNTSDTHWLRTDILGAINEPASGNGFQVEASASYQMNAAFSIGAGVRYWFWNATGQIDLEQAEGVGGLAMAQPGTFNIQRYGYYAQAAYKFGVD